MKTHCDVYKPECSLPYYIGQVVRATKDIIDPSSDTSPARVLASKGDALVILQADELSVFAFQVRPINGNDPVFWVSEIEITE